MGAARISVEWMKVVGVLLSAAACSTTSTIARVHGSELEGSIVGGSRDSIFMTTDAGRECEIQRDEVSSIDFPGNVHRNVGIAVTAYGALNIALGVPQCNERTQDKAAFCTGVFLPAALGLGLMAWGILVEHGQSSAVADISRPTRQRTGSASSAKSDVLCTTPGSS